MADRLCRAGAGLALVLVLIAGGLAGCAQLSKDLDALSGASPKVFPDKKPKAKIAVKADAGQKVKTEPKDESNLKLPAIPSPESGRAGAKASGAAKPEATAPHVFRSDTPYLRLTLPRDFLIDPAWPHETGILVRAWLPERLRLEVKILPRPEDAGMAGIMAGQRRRLKESFNTTAGPAESAILGGLTGVRFGFELDGISYLRYLLPDGARFCQITVARRGMPREEAMAHLAALRLNPLPAGALKKTAGLSIRDLAYSFGARQMGLAVSRAEALAKEKPKDARAALLAAECLAVRHLGLKFAGRATVDQDWAGQRVLAWRLANKMPSDPAGWRTVALIRLIEGRGDRAAKFIEKALKLDRLDAYSLFAKVLIDDSGPVDRELALGKVLDARPDLAGARLMLAGIMESQGRLRSARDQYQAVLKDQPDNTAALSALSRLLMAETGQGRKAAELLLRLVSLESDNTVASFNLALVRVRLKQFDLAEQQLNQILKVRPKDTSARNLLGLAQRGQGRYQEAARNFERAIADDPARPGAHYNLGALCADKLNDRTCAVRAFRRFLELEPMSPRAAKVRRWLQAHGG